MGYIRVPHFDFPRGIHLDFLLSPVSTPDTVIDSLSVLWELKLEASRTKNLVKSRSDAPLPSRSQP